MRKIVLFLLCFIVSAFVFGQGLITDFTAADEIPLVTKGDFVLRGTALVQYLGEAMDVVIPSDLGITEIGDDAFQQAEITSITIPEGVERIGRRAFIDCYSLSSVGIPKSVRVLDSRAFEGCRQLASVSLPDNLLVMGGSVFEGSGIKGLTVPSAVTTISSKAFFSYSNDRFSSITMPADVAYVDEDAGVDRFGAAYNSNGKKAGTYTHGFGGWYLGTSIPAAEEIPSGGVRNGEIRQDTSHLYRASVPAGHSLMVSLAGAGGGYFYKNLGIYDSSGKIVFTDVNNSGNIKSRVIPIGIAGTYYITVGGVDADARGGYSLSVSSEMLRVTDISPGVTYNAELQAGSQQFYRITIPSGNVKLTASIESSIATVIELYNGNGERITYNNSGKNVKVSPYYALLVGEYFIKVAGYYNTTAGSYSLHVTTEAVTR